MIRSVSHLIMAQDAIAPWGGGFRRQSWPGRYRFYGYSVCSVSTGMPVGIPLLFPAGEEGAQVAHLVGSVFTPAHAAVLHPLADHGLAGRFDRAGADRPALGPVGRVVHPMDMILEVAQHFAVDLPHRLASIPRERP